MGVSVNSQRCDMNRVSIVLVIALSYPFFFWGDLKDVLYASTRAVYASI